MRFETVGDTKVAVFDSPVETLDVCRHIAAAKTHNGKDGAFAVVNLTTLVARFNQWRTMLPRVAPFYAVKCNNDATLMKVLADLGAGFDCASKAEMSMVMDEQLVGADKVIYANPCKTRSYIKHAEKVGIRKMTFDNEEELLKISELHMNAEMVLRIAVSDPTAQCPLNVKFGCDPVVEAPKLLQKAKEQGIAVIGISFHVGSGCNDPAAFRAAITYARTLFDIGLALGHNMKLLDIGGGFPGHDTPRISFKKIVNVITPCLDEFFPADENVEIIAEPGRFFASAPISICCNVISATKVPASRITQDEADESRDGYMYYINDGVYGSFNCILFDHYQPTGTPLFDDDNDASPKYPTTIWGPTCDGLDQVEAHTDMKQLHVGDWVYYPHMGAYTTVAASKFNGFDKPKIYHFIDQNNWQQLYSIGF